MASGNIFEVIETSDIDAQDDPVESEAEEPKGPDTWDIRDLLLDETDD